MKQAKKSCGTNVPKDCKITQMIKELEFKLKIFDKDRADL